MGISRNASGSANKNMERMGRTFQGNILNAPETAVHSHYSGLITGQVIT